MCDFVILISSSSKVVKGVGFYGRYVDGCLFFVYFFGFEWFVYCECLGFWC